MNLKYIKQNTISLENPRRTKAKEPEAQSPEGFPSVVLALFRLLSLPHSSNHRSLKAHSQPLPQVGILCVVCCCLAVSDALRPQELQPSRLLCPWGFSRQEYWSGWPCPPPGDLLNPGESNPSLMFPASAGRFFTTSAAWEAQWFPVTVKCRCALMESTNLASSWSGDRVIEDTGDSVCRGH